MRKKVKNNHEIIEFFHLSTKKIARLSSNLLLFNSICACVMNNNLFLKLCYSYNIFPSNFSALVCYCHSTNNEVFNFVRCCGCSNGGKISHFCFFKFNNLINLVFSRRHVSQASTLVPNVQLYAMEVVVLALEMVSNMWPIHRLRHVMYLKVARIVPEFVWLHFSCVLTMSADHTKTIKLFRLRANRSHTLARDLFEGIDLNHNCCNVILKKKLIIQKNHYENKIKYAINN